MYFNNHSVPYGQQNETLPNSDDLIHYIMYTNTLIYYYK